MKRPDNKLIMRLTILGVVVVCGALGFAQALPHLSRVDSSQESPEPDGPQAAEDTGHVPMAPITMQVDPGTAEIDSEMPEALSQTPRFDTSSPEASGYVPTGASQWQGPDASRDGAHPAVEDYQPPSQFNQTQSDQIPAFDEPAHVDVAQVAASDEPLDDPAVTAAAGDDDQFVSDQPPPLVGTPAHEAADGQPASLGMNDDRMLGRTAILPLPASDGIQTGDDFADSNARPASEPVASLQPLEAPPQFGDTQQEFDDTQQGLTDQAQGGAPPLQMEQADVEPVPMRSDFQDPQPMAAPPLNAVAETTVDPGPQETRFDAGDQGSFPSALHGAGEGAELGTLGPPAATGKPGPAELEGPRTPSLTIEKVAPSEVRVGSTAKFLVRVRNVGQVPADQVLVRDEIPRGTRLISTVPQADQLSDGAILWQMGTVKPGEEVTVTMELAPQEEGQVGSVATVSFQTSASARAIATKPQLELSQTAPPRVLIGQDVVFSIRLSNPGTGSANNVIIEENVPDGLKHAAGNELEFEVGTLKPGETRELELTLAADRQGVVDNLLVARADANLVARDSVQVEIISPQLEIQLEGPERRYLQREATYSISLVNPGTAPAVDVGLIAHLPRGLKFVQTNNAGYYDQASHAVHWNLEELPAGQMGTVQLKLQPIEMGPHKIRVESKAQMGLSHAVEKEVLVEGLAALLFTVADVTDPIEVGGRTMYEIRVVNQGSKTATNVQLVAAVPPGMRATGGDGPTQVKVGPQHVEFEPLPRLKPKSDVTYKIHVEGQQPGDKRFRVQLTSDDMSQPVVKEESTRVYAD